MNTDDRLNIFEDDDMSEGATSEDVVDTSNIVKESEDSAGSEQLSDSSEQHREVYEEVIHCQETQQREKGSMEDTALIDLKFRDIEKNILKQVGGYSSTPTTDNSVFKRDTLRFSLVNSDPTDTEEPRSRLMESDESTYRDRDAHRSRYHSDYDDYDYDDDDDTVENRKNIMITSLAVLAGLMLILVIVYTFNTVLRPLNDNGRIQELTRQVGKLEESIKEKEKTIEEQETDLEIYESQIESLQEQVDSMTESIETKDTEIKELNTTLEETQAELKEMQFRADMFQKYGPDWER